MKNSTNTPMLGSHSNGVLNTDVPEIDGDGTDPVVITGFSLKFPGEATSSEGLWNILKNKKCVTKDFPPSRLNAKGFLHKENRMSTLTVKGGHFIEEDLAGFDAEFFSISPAEAMAMDPSQRWLLETTYRALENAGLSLDSVAGTSTGVYTGSFGSDYTTQMYRDPETSPKYASVGVGLSMLANRLSWFFDLRGPSIGLDTACSSGATAFDMACRGLKDGSVNMSLVAGCNLTFAPEVYLTMTNLDFLSTSGRCFSFDHRAQGYARGEGIVVLVLKRLSDAIKNGDVIRAVVRSTACNEDGRTLGITQPSGIAQERLIRHTYQIAGLDMSHTRYFEAHGTGTPIGDPREAQAIGMAFRQHRTKHDPLYIGTVKSNIGHLEGASGLAGIVKTILVLEKGMIPPNANFEKLNPKIDDAYLRLKFPEECTPWPSGGLRRASVNSFGYGGSNSHVVLDDAYNYMKLRGLRGRHNTIMTLGVTLQNGANGHSKDDAEARLALVVWSAADKDGITRILRSYSAYFKGHEDLPAYKRDQLLSDLTLTLNMCRTHLPWRCYAVIGPNTAWPDIELLASIPVKASLQAPRLGFVFSGQGAQWCGMARELLHYELFSNEMQRAGSYLKSIGCTWDTTEELLKPESQSRINEAEVSQTLCTVIQVAMVNLLAEFSVFPSAVVGHSSGEIAAAYASGYLTQESAWKVAYFRGICSAKLADTATTVKGSMLAVGTSETQIQDQIQRLNKSSSSFGLSLACVNSPRSITVSGEENLIDTLKAELDEQGVFTRKLRVPLAYHSTQMKIISETYASMIGELDSPGRVTTVPMVSSVTGNVICKDKTTQAAYWALNMVSTVRFSGAVTVMCAAKSVVKKLDGSHLMTPVVDHLVEIGPHSVLQGPINDVLKSTPRESTVGYSSLLKRNVPSVDTLLSALGQLFCHGYKPDLNAVNECLRRLPGSLKVDLPEYPFDHGQRFWHEGRLSQNYRLRERGPSDMIGTRVNDWNPSDARWRHFIRPAEMPWVEDHVVQGSILFPAAGMLVMAMEALKQLTTGSKHVLTGFLFEDVQFLSPIKVGGQTGQEPEVQVSLRERSAGHSEPNWEFNIRTYAENEWSLNCLGSVTAELRSADAEDWEAARSSEQRQATLKQFATEAQDACTSFVDSKTMYGYLDRQGYGYGPAFRCLEQQKYSLTGVATAKTCLFRTHEIEPLTIHPASLDSIFHLGLTARSVGGSKATDLSIPATIRTLWISNGGLGGPDDHAVTAYSCVTQDTSQGFTVSGLATSNDSFVGEQPRLWLEGFELRTIKAKSPEPPNLPNPRQWHMTVNCKPDVSKMSTPKLYKYLKALHPPRPENDGFRRDLEYLVIASLKSLLSQVDFHANDGSQLDMWHKHYWHWAQYQLKSRELDPLQVNISASESAMQKFDLDRLRNQAERTPVGKIYSLVSSNLVDLFKGQITPMELYVDTNQFKSLYEFEYQSNGRAQATSLIDLLAHSNPELKVLEIGGGTGGGTRYFIKALRNQPDSSSGSLRCSKYHFTDISPAYFPALQEDFKDCLSQMTFSTLDLDKDFGEQGLEEASYDVIVAVDVLHLPSNLIKSLSQVRKVLKPGGRLIMREMFEPTGWTSGFVFGLFSGWWVGVDGQDGLNRTLGPSVTLEQWNSLLQAAGFDGYDVCLSDEDSLLSDQNSGWIVTSRQKAKISAAQLFPDERPRQQGLIIIDPECAQQKAFALKLQEIVERLTGQTPVILDLTAAAAVLCEGTVSTNALTLSLLNYKPSFLRSKLDESLWTGLQSLMRLVRCQLWISIGGSVLHPDTAMIEGLARTLRSEQYGLHLVTLSLESPESIQSLTKVIQEVVDFNSAASAEPRQYEQEYVEIDSMLHTRRLAEATGLKGMVETLVVPYELSSDVLWRQPSFAISTCSDELGDTPHYIEALDVSTIYPTKGNIGENNKVKEVQENEELTIMVREMVLDGADAAFFSSNVSSREGEVAHQGLGRFCAGLVTDIGAGPLSFFNLGDRVCLTQSGVFRSHLKALSRDAALIPSTMSYQEACLHIPPMAAALKALLSVAHVKMCDRVLVHDGMTPIGQAVIYALTHLGVADFWVTVTSGTESDWVNDILGVPREHIIPKTWFINRAMLVSQLMGKFDLVIQADFLDPESLLIRAAKNYGRYINFGVSSRFSSSFRTSRSPRAAAPSNMRFSTVYLDQLWDGESVKVDASSKSLMNFTMEVVSSFLTLKKVSSPSQLQVTYLQASDLRGIFDHLHRLQKMDRLHVTFDNMDIVPVHLRVRPPQFLDYNGSFLIVGGLGGLGRAIARWLVSRGARSLILLSRSGPKNNPDALVLLEELKNRDIKVQTPQCDATNKKNLEAVLQHCSQGMAPIKGCIVASMVLKERLFDGTTLQDWDAVIQPKVAVSWNLHELLPKGLDFFILLSSLAGIVGRASLSAYNAGNVYQDQLAHYRHMLGERATSFNLGGIVDEGYLAQHGDRMAGFRRIDQTELVYTKEILAMLDIHCDTRSQTVGADNMGKSWQHIIGIRPPAHWKNELEVPFTMSQPFWGHMHHLIGFTEAPTSASGVTHKKPYEAIREAMCTAGNPGEGAAIACEALCQRVSTTLAIPKERLDLRTSLVSYGIDSLAAMDLRNWIGTVFKVDIPIFNIQGGASMMDLAQIISLR